MLVQQHASTMYRLATAIVGATDAHDVTQESFTAAWRELPKLRNPDAFPQWLRRICVNRCRAHIKTAQRAPISLEAGGAEALPMGRDFRDAVDARAVLAPAFRNLSTDQRAVLALHYGLGLSISEAADAMRVPTGTAKSRLNAALRTMRGVIEAPVGVQRGDEQVVSQ